MKKIGLVVLVVAVLGITLGATGLVHAQAPTQQTPLPAGVFGFGMHMSGGVRGRMMGANAQAVTQDGLLHDEMITFFAEKLDISVDDLNAHLAAGETMSAIALSTGMTIEEFRTLMIDARSQALDQAVAAGSLTREQVDWMKTRGTGQMMGAGSGSRNGMGQFANPDCPYDPQVQP